MVIDWLRNSPSASTRDCIQHFTPYLTDEAKKIPAIPLHVPIEGAPTAERSASIAGTEERDIDALAYAGYPEKRGLDVLIQAWNLSGLGSRRRLRITGIERDRALEFLKKKGIEL